MKKRLIGILMVVVLLLSACSQTVEDRIKSGEQFLRTREYDEAIGLFESVIEDDPSQFDAWHGYVKAMIRDEQYAHAEEALSRYFEAVKANFDVNSDVVNKDLIRDIVNFGSDIQSEGERLGSWYDVLDAPTLDIYEMSGSYDVGESIALEVPSGVTLYYTLDGSDPDPREPDQKYTEPFTIEEEGEFSLQVIAVNDYGIESMMSYAWISSYTMPAALEPSIPGGSYEGNIQIFFEDYNYDTMDLMYTLDGSNPMDYGLYYDEYYGIELAYGDYTLRAIYYDYNTGSYSHETYVEYSLDNPYALSDYTEVTVAIFDVHEWAMSEIEYALDDINNNFNDLWVDYYYVYSLEELEEDLASGYAQMAYCPSTYVEGLASNDLIAPLDDVYSLIPGDYYSNALDAGLYEDDYYTLPVTISPNQMLYYSVSDIDGEYEIDIDTWDQLVTVANDGKSAYNFLFPMDKSGEWVLSFYLGLGGLMTSNGLGGYDVDEGTMVEAMNLAYNLPNIYGLGFDGMDEAVYIEAIEYAEATMIYGDMADLELYNGTWNYTPSGPMPLPNDSFAKSINGVDGLHVAPAILVDEDMLKISQLIYDYVSGQSYVNYIAGYGEGIPALMSEVSVDDIYLYGNFDDYEFAVMNNITLAYNDKLEQIMNAITFGMYSVVYEGASIDETAKTIVDSAK